MYRRLALLSVVTALAFTFATRADALPLSGVTSLSSNEDHSCVRLSNGQAGCWGTGGDGEIGDGSMDSVADVRTVRGPVGTAPLGGIAQMATGWYHSCALLRSGEVRCWGYADDGQLGDGSTDPDYRPRARVVKNRQGTGPLTGATQITAGERHTCVVIQSGQARCWGQNYYGELGTGAALPGALSPLARVVRNPANTAPLTGVAQVDGGKNFTCARLTNGQVRCWGENGDGQLGDGSTDDSSLPVVVRYQNGNPLTGVTQLSAGQQHVCVRLGSGQARCWGAGGSGRLGNGTATPYPNPHVVTSSNGGPPLTGVSQIDAGGEHSCARMASGQARCWGDSFHGQLGWNDQVDSYNPVTVVNAAGSAPLQGVRQIRTGYWYSCAVLQNGQVRCWGRDQNGELGNGPGQDDSLTPDVVVR